MGVTLDGAFTSRAEQDCYGRVTEKKLTIEGSTEALLTESYGYLETSAGFETRLTGMVQVLTRRVKGEIKDTQRYTYDNNGNITAVRNGSGTEYHAKYTYDGINQLIREDNAVLGKSWTFSYDTAGNILSKKEYAYTTGTLGSVLDTKTYTYAGTGWKDRLISWDGEAIEYDAMGNPTTYLGHALTWGKIRQLESYRIDSNTLLTYAYDAGGVRIRKGAVSYQVDGTRILRETRPAGTITYEYGNGGVCGFQYDNTKYYYEKNLQGDITGIYDAGGNLKAEYAYDAWGNPVVTVDIDGIGTLNPFRYRGYYYDTETGLYYLNSRYYDPRTCRFISADDILEFLFVIGSNVFTYCGNNPIIYADISGCRRKPAVKRKNKKEHNYEPLDKAFHWVGEKADGVKDWLEEAFEWIGEKLKTDNGYALYDSCRNGRRGPFREQILAFTASKPSFDMKTGNVGLGSLSLDLATGGWEYDNFDISLFDVGHAEFSAELKDGELSVGAFVSAWSPSISFKLGKYNITLSLELLSFGGDFNVSKKSFEAKGAWGWGLGLAVDW